MKANYLLTVLVPFLLAACSSPNTSTPPPPANGGGKKEDNPSRPAIPVSPGVAELLAGTELDCAGFREKALSLFGGSVANEKAYNYRIFLEADGTFEAFYYEAGMGLPRKKITGRWTSQGDNLELNGLGRGYTELFFNRRRLVLKLTENPGNLEVRGSYLYLSPFADENGRKFHSKIGKCSPKDNPAMTRGADGAVLINGQPAEEYWRTEVMNDEEGRRVGYAFRRGSYDITVRIYDGGIFKLKLTDDGRVKTHIGDWEIRDGLVVLVDWGVLVPQKLQPEDPMLVPVLYLMRDPFSQDEITYQNLPLTWKVR